jgi:hypothetical protein
LKVANYFPAGNWMGEFRENVLPLTSDSSPIKSVKNDDIGKNKLKKFNTDQPKLYENSPAFSKARGAEDNMQSKFITEALECHNACRRKHGSPNLTHNPGNC